MALLTQLGFEEETYINLGSNPASAIYHEALYKPLQISEPHVLHLETGVNYN